MPAEVPFFRLESPFLNRAAFGDRSEAASAGCPLVVPPFVGHAGAVLTAARFSISTRDAVACTTDGYAGWRGWGLWQRRNRAN
jgi:hypothetical protein